MRLDHRAPRPPRRARVEGGRRRASRRGNSIVQCRDGAFDFSRHSSDDGRRVVGFRARGNERTRANERTRSSGRRARGGAAATTKRSSAARSTVVSRDGGEKIRRRATRATREAGGATLETRERIGGFVVVVSRARRLACEACERVEESLRRGALRGGHGTKED